jgi:hypothetical protein
MFVFCPECQGRTPESRGIRFLLKLCGQVPIAGLCGAVLVGRSWGWIATPVPLIGKRFAMKNAHHCEETPTVLQTRLSGRKARLLNGNDFVVMKNVPVN